MVTRFELGDVTVAVTRRDVRNVHLSVHPPDGAVTLVAPRATRLDVARAYAISRLPWIRAQQARFRAQRREPAPRYVDRESHFVWGHRRLLRVIEEEAKPTVTVDHRRITLRMRPGSTREQRERVMRAWHRTLLHEAIPPMLERWAATLGVRVAGYHLQRMKTRWGSCNHEARTIRLNTELATKPRDLLEYVIVHELLHLVDRTHGPRFQRLLDRHYPAWREARQELNALPLPVIG